MLSKNEKQAGFEHEGRGEYRTAWAVCEITCPDCGRRTKDYGNASITDEDGRTIELCNDCANRQG